MSLSLLYFLWPAAKYAYGQGIPEASRYHPRCVYVGGGRERLELLVHTCRAPTSLLSRGIPKEGLSPMDLMIAEGLRLGFLKNLSPEIC